VTGACSRDSFLADVTDPDLPPDSVAVVSIEMLPSERALSFIGMTDRMGARRVLADGTLKGSRLNPHLFAWSSDTPGVVTVDSLGVVTAVSEGTAKITTTSGGVTGTAMVTVRQAVRLAWSAPVGLSPTALTIGVDGTIYVPTRDTLHALAPGGQRRWSVRSGAEIHSAPAIAADGTLYIGTGGARGSLMAIDRSGAVRWNLNTGWIFSAPAVGPDGTIYAASVDSTLYAVDPAGQKKWQFRGQGLFFLSSPAIAWDGTILVGGHEDGRLYAVSPDGAERWTFQTGASIRTSPAIAPDGTIYVTSDDQHLYALNLDGSLEWSLPLPLATASQQSLWSPAIGSDGTVYVGGRGLHAIDPTGQLLWTYRGTNPSSGTQVFGTPIVAGDGTIYVSGGISTHVFALAADGTLKWDHPTRGPVFGVPAIGLDGTIFAASSLGGDASGTLYAIVERGGSNGGYASAPWPKHRGDRANMGHGGARLRN
jgi:outer membrane protein assembly factor BamB